MVVGVEPRGAAQTTAERQPSYARGPGPGAGFASISVNEESRVNPSCAWESNWLIPPLTKVRLSLEQAVRAAHLSVLICQVGPVHYLTRGWEGKLIN